MKTAAVILAAGVGERMNSDVSKQQMLLLGKSILSYTVEAFDRAKQIEYIELVVRENEVSFAKEIVNHCHTPAHITIGGTTRQESSHNGVVAVPAEFTHVAIHDGARCLITPEDIDTTVECAYQNACAIASVAIPDTLKRADETGHVAQTISRNQVYLASTPQVLARHIYEKGYEKANREGLSVTDDSQLAELIGQPVTLVPTSSDNFKITWAKDILRAEQILKSRMQRMTEIRVGHGYDVHRLVENRDLILGGVKIPYEKGLLGHSDADVLIHAIMDALLGAIGEGDIGQHFPDSDNQYAGISSMILLKKVSELLHKQTATVVNIDATVVMQKPKLAEYIFKMKENIADTLGIKPSRINIKATTEEKLGFTGSGEGAAAHVVAAVRVLSGNSAE